ncbi:MAG: flippase-like domain-containing protein [Chloroflexi bacterium]|nr:flippase-like domain-containing protein [Chloroflexota bacterium]
MTLAGAGSNEALAGSLPGTELRGAERQRAGGVGRAFGRPAGLVRIAVVVVITLVVLASLAHWAGTTDVMSLIRGSSPAHLAAVLLLTLTLPISHAWRLQAALLATDNRLGFGHALRLTMAVWPISSLTPAKSGDLVKAYYLRHEIPPTVTAGALLAERAVDLAIWGALSFAASLFFEQPVVTLFSAAVLGAVLVFLFGLAPRADRLPIPARWADRARLLLASTSALARRPGLLLTMVGLTLANCAATILVTGLLFDAVGASVPLPFVTAAVLPAMFAGLLPFTLAGMGTRDSVLIVLFADYASAAQSLSVGLLYAFFFRWLLSLLGLPFLQRVARETPNQT